LVGHALACQDVAQDSAYAAAAAHVTAASDIIHPMTRIGGIARCVLAMAAAAALHAQAFDPRMPASVPQVTGTVVDGSTLRYIDVKAGEGEPARPGQRFTVHYTGWLRDGTQFDSSIGKDPIQFVQGRREVISGWDMGFAGMRVGGKRRLFVPYQLAYGEKGRGSIPPKAELIFDVELLAAVDVPDKPAASDLLLPLSDLTDKVTKLAAAVPEEKYAWRPGEGVRSFRQVFLHIAYGNHLLLDIANGLAGDALQKRIADQAESENQPATKAKVLESLAESFTAVREALEAERNASLNRDADFFGTATTRRGLLATIDTHIAEHLGQAIAYARMNGIVPPWSK